jgi:hypothetical protein
MRSANQRITQKTRDEKINPGAVQKWRCLSPERNTEDTAANRARGEKNMKRLNIKMLKSTVKIAFLLLLMTAGVAAQDGRSPFAGSWKSEKFSININEQGKIDSFSLDTQREKYRSDDEPVNCEDSTEIKDFKNESGKLNFSFGCNGNSGSAMGYLDGETLKFELYFSYVVGLASRHTSASTETQTIKFDLKREADQKAEQDANVEKPTEQTASDGSWSGSANISINENGTKSESELNLSDFTIKNANNIFYAFALKIGGNTVQCSSGEKAVDAQTGDADTLKFSFDCGSLKFTGEAKTDGDQLELEIEGKEAAKNLTIEKTTVNLTRKK